MNDNQAAFITATDLENTIKALRKKTGSSFIVHATMIRHSGATANMTVDQLRPGLMISRLFDACAASLDAALGYARERMPDAVGEKEEDQEAYTEELSKVIADFVCNHGKNRKINFSKDVLRRVAEKINSSQVKD